MRKFFIILMLMLITNECWAVETWKVDGNVQASDTIKGPVFMADDIDIGWTLSIKLDAADTLSLSNRINAKANIVQLADSCGSLRNWVEDQGYGTEAGNDTTIRGISISTIPPSDNYILKYDLAKDTVVWEPDLTGAGGSEYTDSIVHDGRHVVGDSLVLDAELAAFGYITAKLTQEEVQDYVGGLLGGTETRISVTYDDESNNISFVVDDMNDDVPDANEVVEAALKAVNEPADEDIFTYESTTGDFEWQTAAESGLATVTQLGAKADTTDSLHARVTVIDSTLYIGPVKMNVVDTDGMILWDYGVWAFGVEDMGETYWVIFDSGDVSCKTLIADSAIIADVLIAQGKIEAEDTVKIEKAIEYKPVVYTLPTASSVAVVAGGYVTDGDHYYRITYVTDAGESDLGAISAVATTGDGDNTVNLTNIPISSEDGVTARNIYRTQAAYPSAWGVLWREYYHVKLLEDNVTTVYSDTVMDASLGGEANNYEHHCQINFALGRGALANKVNVSSSLAIGFGALGKATGGTNCTAVGIGALANQTAANRNTAIGAGTLFNNTTGIENDAFGQMSLYNNTTGQANAGICEFALFSNTTGSWNVGVGADALAMNTTGNRNTGLGYMAGFENTIGSDNIMIGFHAGILSSPARRNVLIGSYAVDAGYAISNINNNVILGYGAGGYIADNCSSNVFLGYYAGAQETGSNKLYIENTYSANPLIYGDFELDSIRINGNFSVTGTSKFTGTVTGVTATMVGLGNCDNTSDANKPVSTAQATALGAKADTTDHATRTYVGQFAQPLEATLTDIADGTIAEDLVNTAYPWADNEVADAITVTGYQQDSDTTTFDLTKTQAAAAYQPLEATLTDIADGTIAEDLVNTAYPWADNEIASSGNWNTAYGWGDWSGQGFITAADVPANETDAAHDNFSELAGSASDGQVDDNITVTGYQQDSDTTTSDLTKTQAAALYQGKFGNFQCTIIDPKNVVGGSAIVWKNGISPVATITIDSINALSQADDYSFTLTEYTNTGAAAGGTVDAIDVDANGTGMFYKTETTLTHNVIETGNIILFTPNETDSTNWVQLIGYFHW